jgi:hypothetical protein
MKYNFTPKGDTFDKVVPWISTIILLPFLIYFTLNRGAFNFIDYVNLLIHEGGHGIFSFFGEFIYTAGGTLMQMILPSLFLVYYIWHRHKLGFQLSLFWLGENLMNISVYASDARAHRLPLIGKNTYHDWTWMLSRLDLMAYDTLIGDIFYYAGVVCFVIVLIAPIIIKKKEADNSRIELDLNI